MRILPRVCIIGAGSSGIAACKALYDRAIPYDCFEKGDRVGGNWVFKNTNGLSSAYRSLHINTSRDRMAYADYPMPRDYPDFPHHELIARYFDAYVDHFGFRHTITFKTGVARAEKRPEDHGLWRVTLDTGEQRLYDALMVANGHHWDPRWPEPPFPGRFDGVQMHSHYYIDPDEPHALTGKRVVIVGMGNSAMDIACELSRPGVAARVFLAMRRGAWIIPNYMLGRPVDSLPFATAVHVPFALRRAVGALAYRLTIGRLEDYGLPTPDHRIGEAHPTISSDLLVRIGRGDIVPKPNLAELCGDRVRFTDGSEERADAVIYCTGYKVSFPFFDPGLVSAPDNDLPLFRRMVKPEHPDLFFIGLFQPLGAIMPLAEAQSKLVAEYLTGEYALPTPGEMAADIARERTAMFKRYVRSPRHTMQVDGEQYLHELAREVKHGRARAKRTGNTLPVAPRASKGEARALAASTP